MSTRRSARNRCSAEAESEGNIFSSLVDMALAFVHPKLRWSRAQRADQCRNLTLIPIFRERSAHGIKDAIVPLSTG